MPKVSRASAAVRGAGPVEDRYMDVDGWTISFLTFNADIDATPLMHGLPDERCQCPHWGYVLRGRMTFRFADREEVVEAGDAFYLPPGHVPIAEAGTEYVQFSPAEELKVVGETLEANMRAMMAAGGPPA
ncbi:MAG TPA: cupin domain-containing protein [Conexibacter sp.]|nr:cupin domain-containing protein [Conexibacter sp.]